MLMTEPAPLLPPPRPGFVQWLVLVVMACWLAVVPLTVTAVLSAAADHSPELLVELGVIPPGDPQLPEWAFGLLATALSLGGHLLAFVPLQRSRHALLRTTATLLMAIAAFQTLNSLAQLLGLGTDKHTLTAALRLILVLPFLLLGLGWIEASKQNRSLGEAWRRVGLRLWLNPSAGWLALGSAAVIVWPWVLVGSLGSQGATAANALQALPNALGEEILFRGFAFAWLWRAVAAPPQALARSARPSLPRTGGRFEAAAGSLLLFVAAQGGTVLPCGDWGCLPRFFAALLLGLLATELTVRAGGSVWPAIAMHFLYDFFALAFVDPRSREELLHWLAHIWMPVAAGGVGLLLWLGRKMVRRFASRRIRGGLFAAAGVTGVAWAAVIALYLALGVPGFHSDGFLIFLEEQADLSPAAAIADPVERRAWVYDTLVETAERSQVSLRAELDQRGVPYRPHYLANAIEVLDHPGLRRKFARQPGVASVLFQPGMRRYARTFDVLGLNPGVPRGVEWNVREVGADRVWARGYTGEGVIVGSADTGVAWDHPALKEAYLGWDGRSVDHGYHWYDPWDGRSEPWDDSGHGTHTTGTMVGLDGENQVGLAPGARWIACRNMRHGIGNPGSYLSCMEFLLAPFPLDGDPLHDGDPAQGAHVVNNSWGCPKEEGCLPDTLRTAVENLRAAGQMVVAGAGNDGPACGTVQDAPAIYDATITVGAITRSDRVASFSSRGPVTVGGNQHSKPDLVAPGLDIRSSVPGGYDSLPGTSMAGPHVAGAVALLWSVDPALVADVDQTETILIETAQRLTVDATCPGSVGELGVVCACGGDGPRSVPNNVYGWGQVDVWAAVRRLLEGQ